jgi:hypothetical protein
VALNRHNLKGESWDTVEDQQAVIFTIHTRGSTDSYLYYPHSRQVNVRGSMILSSEAQVASSDARINFSFDILAFKLYVVLFDNLYRIYNVKKKNQKKNRCHSSTQSPSSKCSRPWFLEVLERKVVRCQWGNRNP